MAFVRLHSSLRQKASGLFATDRPNVLYVEDEDLNWEIAQRELEGRFRMTRAVNAKEACSLLEWTNFHLILMDVQLCKSDVDGMDLAKILKGKFTGVCPDYAANVRTTTPIIFVTAHLARWSREDLVEAGAEDLITKPVNFMRLSLAIARVWASAASHGQAER